MCSVESSSPLSSSRRRISARSQSEARVPFQFRENACRPHSRPRAVARPAGTGVVVADGDDEGHISRVPRTSALASTLSRARDVVKRRSIAQRRCRFKRANPSGGVATGAVRARLRRAVRVDAFVVADDSPSFERASSVFVAHGAALQRPADARRGRASAVRRHAERVFGDAQRGMRVRCHRGSVGVHRIWNRARHAHDDDEGRGCRGATTRRDVRGARRRRG